MSDQVSDVAADLCAGIIDPDLGPQLLKFTLEPHGDLVFLPGKAVNFDELDKKIFEPFLINQTLYLDVLVMSRKHKNSARGALSIFDLVNLP